MRALVGARPISVCFPTTCSPGRGLVARDTELELQSNWPAVLASPLIFHGLAGASYGAA